MDVSSGDPRVPLLVAPKMDEEFYGIFTYYIVYSGEKDEDDRR